VLGRVDHVRVDLLRDRGVRVAEEAADVNDVQARVQEDARARMAEVVEVRREYELRVGQLRATEECARRLEAPPDLPPGTRLTCLSVIEVVDDDRPGAAAEPPVRDRGGGRGLADGVRAFAATRSWSRTASAISSCTDQGVMRSTSRMNSPGSSRYRA
jgi:hypothetical protein